MDPVKIVIQRDAEKKHSWVYVNKSEGISFYIPKKIVGEVNPPLQLSVTLTEIA